MAKALYDKRGKNSYIRLKDFIEIAPNIIEPLYLRV